MTIELVLLSRVAYRDREITSPRLRGLLALLAADLRAGRSTGRLVEGLWPDEQPENPTKALQILVSRARSQLGADVIANTPTGYRLALDDNQVDAAAVLRTVAEAAEQARAGDHEAALRAAESGLALWAGVPGQEGDDPLSDLRTERAASYRSLVRARALALSRLGRSEAAVESLLELTGDYPRDEEILLELMRCEAATAGPAAALARYDTYRRTLRDELGTDPGSALRAVHQQLLRNSAPPVRHGIPHEPNPLLGRAEDVAAVTALLRTSRVASIVGPGGLGKTRLAHVVSRDAEQRVVHFVPLAGVGSDEDVAGEVASALGVGEPRRTPVGRVAASPDLLTGIVTTLGPGQVLLVLDNCEHVIRGAAELVRALVSMTRDLHVLTTSRAPLGLTSESVYLLPELTLPTAVELFDQRARSARPGVELPAEAVRELCGQLDGLPLAVELAAARVRVMSVAEMAHRLADRFTLLRGGARDAPQRHRTLHAVVDWSWHLLESPAQQAMRALSIFPGGFTAEAAERLLGGPDALEIVEDLVDQSLLKVVESPSGTRFRMLETVREFSTAHRDEAFETERVTDRFLGWAREFGIAHHEGLFGPDAFHTHARVEIEQDNLALALRHGLTRSDGATVAAVTAVLGGLWTFESNFIRTTALAEETAWLLSHFRPEPDLVEATRAAAALCTAIAFTVASPTAARSLVILRRLPPAPPDTLGRAIATVLCDTTGSDGVDGSALNTLCESEEPLLAGVANAVATYLWERASEPERALQAAQRTVTASDTATSPVLRVMALSRLGELCMQHRPGDEAQRHLKAALSAQQELWGRPDEIGIRWALAVTELQRGSLDEAVHWLEQAALNEVDQSPGSVIFGIAVRAEISLAAGDTDAGLYLWRNAASRLGDADSTAFYQPDPSLDPWFLEIQSVAVIAHAQHGRIDLVEDITDALPGRLLEMLQHPISNPYYMELPVAGVVLLALAMTDLQLGKGSASTWGARMIALADRFCFLRQWPTTSVDRIRLAAKEADSSAYDEAVSSYAELGRDELRAAALAALQAR